MKKIAKQKRGGVKKVILIIVIVILLAALCVFFLARRYYPLRYYDIIEKYAGEYSLDPELVCAIIHTESRFNENAVSSRGASGLMQIMEDTAYWIAPMAGLENFDYGQIFDPEINIKLGCFYLNMLEKQFGDTKTALSAYNAGSGNVNGWLGDTRYSSDGKTLDYIPFSETDNYVKRVASSEKIYSIIVKFAFIF